MHSIDKIDERLFLGNEAVANSLEILTEHGITHILIAAKELQPHFEGSFVYKKIDIYDQSNADIRKYFGECNQFIDEAISNNGKVLVHCYQGISRSCTIVAAYLIYKKGYSCMYTLDLIKKKHHQCCPNDGFIKQLDEYSQNLKHINPGLEEIKFSKCHCVVF
ncbi:unnamed protein product [Blepharisma stoltei]|uniref:Protein-tyrosine-phosphatase n=1 Tax=Blepharisma stoltei TaxID=1481888 RepID=A0AAU9K8J1_9CILI|nr:unnamed protein product [Blepharisma stoltei]